MMFPKDKIQEALTGLGGFMSTKRLVQYRAQIALIVALMALVAIIGFQILWRNKEDIGPNLMYAYCATIIGVGGHSVTGYLKKEGSTTKDVQKDGQNA